MPPASSPRSGSGAVAELFGRRVEPASRLAEEAPRIAAACHDMAVRFHRGGTLIVFGNGSAATDAQHLAVEFVHPVTVGKRALPAQSLTNDVATLTGIAADAGFAEVFARQVAELGRADDIALGLSVTGNDENVLRGLVAAHRLGALTVAMVGGDGGRIVAEPAVDHVLTARSDDPRVVKEIHVTTYHILWELVHVFFEQPGLLGPAVLR